MKLQRHHILSAITASAMVGFGTSAQAAVLSSFSGYSELLLDFDFTDSIANFAVYQNTDGDWTDDAFFAGGNAATGVVDAAASYVYMYQVLNTNPGGGASENFLDDFSVQGFAGVATGQGFFPHTAFDDAAPGVTPIVGLSNFSLSAVDPVVGSSIDGTPGDGVASVVGVAPDGLAVASGLVNPNHIHFPTISNSAVAGGAPTTGINFQFNIPPHLNPGGTASSVMFVTTNLAPRFTWAETDGFSTLTESAGDVAASAIPEASEAAIVALGLFGLVAHRRRRRTA